jgi:glutathione S-transferase
LVRLTIMAKAPISPEQLALAEAAAQELFAVADAALSKAAFMAGVAFTLADIGVGVAYRRWSSLPVARGPLPALEAWFMGVSARPGFAAILA